MPLPWGSGLQPGKGNRAIPPKHFKTMVLGTTSSYDHFVPPSSPC